MYFTGCYYVAKVNVKIGNDDSIPNKKVEVDNEPVPRKKMITVLPLVFSTTTSV